MSQARDFWYPGAWPLKSSSGERFLYCVFRGAKVAVATHDGAEHLRASSRSRRSPVVASIASVSNLQRVGWRAHYLSHLDLMPSGLPPGPGALDALPAMAYARSAFSTSTSQ